MTTGVSLLVLASSRKHSGFCIAGKRFGVDGTIGVWVRPVSQVEDGSLKAGEIAFPSGEVLKALDIVSVPLERPVPVGHQHENHLVAGDFYWQRIGHATLADLRAAADMPEDLWGTGCASRSGRNNRIRNADAVDLEDSLRLLHLPQVRLLPSVKAGHVDVEFAYRGEEYKWRVTDLQVENWWKARRDRGPVDLGECWITASLGEPFSDGHCYKLAAAIVTRARLESETHADHP